MDWEQIVGTASKCKQSLVLEIVDLLIRAKFSGSYWEQSVLVESDKIGVASCLSFSTCDMPAVILCAIIITIIIITITILPHS